MCQRGCTCRFDFCICTLLIVTTVMRFGSQVTPFRLIRLLRAVRLLRTVRLFPKLAIVIETSVKASSSVVYIALFGVLFSYMFAIVGVAAFGKNDPFYFGNLGVCPRHHLAPLSYPETLTGCCSCMRLARAMLTLFRVLSMDSWSMIMYYNIWGCGQPNWDGTGKSRGYGA
jgi:voltage-gated sodium channel